MSLYITQGSIKTWSAKFGMEEPVWNPDLNPTEHFGMN